MPTVKRRPPATATRPGHTVARDRAIATNFPEAARYAACLPPTITGVHERGRRATPWPASEADPSRAPLFTERHLQGIWFDPQFRPVELITRDGEQVRVLQPGRWNLEAGPDFLDAHLVVGPDRRTLRGDVEVHIHPADWSHHGHAADPLYRNVIAHVCYWPEVLPDGALPRAAIQIALKPALDTDPGFFFESVDVAAYPYAAPPPASPDHHPPLAALPAADATRFLIAAGQERLRRKADLLRDRINRDGEAQPLFESALAGLGYQHNRGICRRLARLVTVERLRTESAGNATTAYALLLGVAGLMPRNADAAWDAPTRRFVRALWDAWWKLQARWEPQRLPPRAWRLTGIRPQNHPVRRLAAAAALFAGAMPFHTSLQRLPTRNAGRWLAGVRALLAVDTEFPYWQTRFTFGGKTAAAPVALIGAQRQSALILNALVPHLAALGHDVTAILDAIPPEDSNQIVRQAAHLVFGPDHNPAIYAGGLQQQGLIQIFHDFCLPNRLDDLARVVTMG